jgi:GAF domain-containing protein
MTASMAPDERTHRMSDLSREQRLNAVLVRLADTLVDDYDVVELLQYLVESCAELLEPDAGGLMLADGDGSLQVIASTSETAELVEIMQLNAGKGPCVECFTTGEPLSIPDIDGVRERWSEFADAAVAGGFRAVHATPLRLRGKTLGAMNLFSTRGGRLSDRDVAAVRTLADVATIGIMQERVIRESGVVTTQLQQALDSRVLIEQAKGILSEAHAISLEQAFDLLRNHARGNRMPLRAVSESIATRALDPAAVRRR